MNKLITGLEYQPGFPYADLTDENASMLELLLQNHSFVQDGHAAADSVSWLFRVGHKAVVRAGESVYEGREQIMAIDHGVAVFEAATSMVADVSNDELLTVNMNAASLTAAGSTRAIVQYADEAIESICTTTPNLTELVKVASARHVHDLTHYALLGAAMSRKFAIDGGI